MATGPSHYRDAERVADAPVYDQPGHDLSETLRAAAAWLDAHPGLPVEVYNATPGDVSLHCFEPAASVAHIQQLAAESGLPPARRDRATHVRYQAAAASSDIAIDVWCHPDRAAVEGGLPHRWWAIVDGVPRAVRELTREQLTAGAYWIVPDLGWVADDARSLRPGGEA
jgi:hypothetical protein